MPALPGDIPLALRDAEPYDQALHLLKRVEGLKADRERGDDQHRAVCDAEVARLEAVARELLAGG